MFAMGGVGTLVNRWRFLQPTRVGRDMVKHFSCMGSVPNNMNLYEDWVADMWRLAMIDREANPLDGNFGNVAEEQLREEGGDGPAEQAAANGEVEMGEVDAARAELNTAGERHEEAL